MNDAPGAPPDPRLGTLTAPTERAWPTCQAHPSATAAQVAKHNCGTGADHQPPRSQATEWHKLKT